MYQSEEEGLRGSREMNGVIPERGRGGPKLHISWSGNRSNLRNIGSGLENTSVTRYGGICIDG